MPVAVVALVGSAVLLGGSFYALNKILTRQRKAAVDDFEDLFASQRARLGETMTVFADGVKDAAEKAFR